MADQFELHLAEIHDDSEIKTVLTGTRGDPFTSEWAQSLGADNDGKIQCAPAALGEFVLSAAKRHGRLIITLAAYDPADDEVAPEGQARG